MALFAAWTGLSVTDGRHIICCMRRMQPHDFSERHDLGIMFGPAPVLKKQTRDRTTFDVILTHILALYFFVQ